MNPGNGRLAQQDSFAGFENRPISLHKYSYANGSPSILTDPSGNFSLVEASAVNQIVGHLSEFNVSSGFDLGNKLANPGSDTLSFEGWSIVISTIPGAVRVGAGLTQNLKFVANAKAGRGWVKALKGTKPKEIRASEFLADHFGATVLARGQAAGADLYIAGKRWKLKVLTTGRPSNAAEKIIDAVKHQNATSVVVDVRDSSLGAHGVEAAYTEVLRKSARDGFSPPSGFLATLPDGMVYTRP